MPKRAEEASGAEGDWKSDHRIVPMKPGNSGGGKAATPPSRDEGAPAALRGGDPVKLRLSRIRQRARAHRKEAFNNLFTHLDAEMLLYAFEQLEDGKATGVDGISLEEYGQGLEARVTTLLDRLHRETYQPQPSRRRYIPKGDGRQRPLGIPATEEKLVQRALADVRDGPAEDSGEDGQRAGERERQDEREHEDVPPSLPHAAHAEEA